MACMLVTFRNLQAWTPRMARWLRRCRLNVAHHESLLTLVRQAWSLRKVLPRALDRMEQILEAEAASPRG